MTTPEENVISVESGPGKSVAEPPESPATGPEIDSIPSPASPASAATPLQAAPRRGETLIQSLLSIAVIVLFVITFIVQAFQIPSGSMEKTLLIGDYLLVDKVHFGEGGVSSWFLPYRELKRGDIVVFHYPVDPSQHFVKRVVGLPGDKIRLHNKTVFVNDQPLQETYAVHVPGNRNFYRDNFPSDPDFAGEVDAHWRSDMSRYLRDGGLVVPRNMYFVMGDNRDHSLDSRYWGFVPRENIVGRPLVVYLSFRNEQESGDAGGNGKLFNSGRLLTHVWQFARWDRMFHLVR